MKKFYTPYFILLTLFSILAFSSYNLLGMQQDKKIIGKKRKRESNLNSNKKRKIDNTKEIKKQNKKKKKNPSQKQALDKCAICLDDIEPKHKINELKCKHVFHKACIERWLNRDNKCPICQTKVHDGPAQHNDSNIDPDFSQIRISFFSFPINIGPTKKIPENNQNLQTQGSTSQSRESHQARRPRSSRRTGQNSQEENQRPEDQRVTEESTEEIRNLILQILLGNLGTSINQDNQEESEDPDFQSPDTEKSGSESKKPQNKDSK